MEESELAGLMDDMDLFQDGIENVEEPDETNVDENRNDAFVGRQPETQASFRNDSTLLVEEDLAFMDAGVLDDVPELNTGGNRTDSNPQEIHVRAREEGNIESNPRQQETATSSPDVGGSSEDHAARILNAVRNGDGHVSRKTLKSREVVEKCQAFKRAEHIEGPFYSVRRPSTGEMLYLPVASRSSGAVESERMERLGGGLLEAPIHDMVEECRKELMNASIGQTERMVEMMDVDPLAFRQNSASVATSDVGSGAGRSTLPWVRAYAPKKYGDLLTDEKMNRDVIKWMKAWDPVVFGKKGRNSNLTNGADRQPPESKVILLSGPPGGGKTTMAKVIAQHCGYRPLVVNASDDRTKSILETKIRDATTMKSILGGKKPNCLILDEVDGMVASEGQGAIDTVLKLMQQGSKNDGSKVDEIGKRPKEQQKRKRKKSKPMSRPLICICNDLYAPVMKSLRAGATVFQFKGVKAEQLMTRLSFICSQEGVHASRKTLQALVEKSNSDIRVCLNTLQYLASKNPVIHAEDVENADLGVKDLQESCFDIWGQLMFKRSGKKRSSSFGLLYKNLQDFGEFELISDGVLENIQCARFMDPLMEKTSRAVESLARGSWFSDASGFGLTQYLPAYLIGAAKEVGSVQRFKLTWPMKGFGLSRSLKANASLVNSWKSKVSPKVLSRNMGCTAVLDLIPALKKILTPSIYSISSENMSVSETFQIKAFANIMTHYGLKYDLSLSNQMGGGPEMGGSRKVRAFIPPIHEFHQYGHGDALPTSHVTMQTINLEIDKLRKSKMNPRGGAAPCERSVGDSSRMMGLPGATPQPGPSQDMVDFSEENYVATTSFSGRQAGDQVMEIDENRGAGGSGIQRQGAFVKKRKGNWLETHRRNQRSKVMAKGQTGKKPPVTFSYDEGKTDSVRRAATLRDFV
ncbi:hypothetical protein BSKO_13099 [Bryopsis sp. KO-2023]|nr:hypothetical protein BSKO_13099 [Bryopsis sp. KO-2023]